MIRFLKVLVVGWSMVVILLAIASLGQFYWDGFDGMLLLPYTGLLLLDAIGFTFVLLPPCSMGFCTATVQGYVLLGFVFSSILLLFTFLVDLYLFFKRPLL